MEIDAITSELDLLDSKEEVDAISRTIIDEFKLSINKSIYTFLLLLTLSMLYLYQVTIVPYSIARNSNPNLIDNHDKLVKVTTRRFHQI